MGSYIYGAPENLGSWNHVASIFAAHDSVFSDETSSLPLVKFWQPKRGGELKSGAKKLLQQCGLNPCDFADAKFCFEYPVPVGKGRGKASMSDLMIITDKHAIAVEAKWTECKDTYQTICDWLKEKTMPADKAENRGAVLDGWIDYINEYLHLGKEGIRRGNIRESKIPYQMLHRIASACQVASRLGRKASVIYQLFYNAETTGNKVDFIDCLTSGYRELFGDGKAVPLRIIETGVEKDIPERIAKQCKTDQGKNDWNELFRLMQTNCIYKFPLKTIKSVSVSD